MRDVAFAPSEFGLKLVCRAACQDVNTANLLIYQASIAADSKLRLYECLDPSSSGLASWSLLEDIDLLSLPNGYYSPSSAGHASHLSHHHQTQLIKGFDDHGSQKGGLGPSGASSASLAAQSTGSSNGPQRGLGRIESSGAWALSYCHEAWWGECLAVSAGSQGLIRVRIAGNCHGPRLTPLSDHAILASITLVAIGGAWKCWFFSSIDDCLGAILRAFLPSYSLGLARWQCAHLEGHSVDRAWYSLGSIASCGNLRSYGR